mgnify:CR=1 FL=1
MPTSRSKFLLDRKGGKDRDFYLQIMVELVPVCAIRCIPSESRAPILRLQNVPPNTDEYTTSCLSQCMLLEQAAGHKQTYEWSLGLKASSATATEMGQYLALALPRAHPEQKHVRRQAKFPGYLCHVTRTETSHSFLIIGMGEIPACKKDECCHVVQ